MKVVRNQQAHVVAGELHARGQAVKTALRAQRGAVTCCQCAHEIGSRVVAGPVVFGSGIAQADDKGERCAHLGSEETRPPAAGGLAHRVRTPAVSSTAPPFGASTVATGRSCSGPCDSSTLSTPAGSLRSERCTIWPTSHVGHVDFDELRQILRQAGHVHFDVALCWIMPPWFFTPWHFSWLMKCSGMWTWSLRSRLTRWKSACRIRGRAGWRCRSFRITSSAPSVELQRDQVREERLVLQRLHQLAVRQRDVAAGSACRRRRSREPGRRYAGGGSHLSPRRRVLRHSVQIRQTWSDSFVERTASLRPGWVPRFLKRKGGCLSARCIRQTSR